MIENKAIIGIADIDTIADLFQIVVMKMAFNICVIIISGKFVHIEHIIRHLPEIRDAVKVELLLVIVAFL